MNETHHPAWRCIRSGYLLPPAREAVWGWDGAVVQQMMFHNDPPAQGGYWTDVADRRVDTISHWMPLSENPDQPPRAPDVFAQRHDGLSSPPADASFVWAFIGDEAPRRAQFLDGHWLDLDGQPLDARGLKWLRELEFTDLARRP